ncbi:hypothetical protein V493_00356 [Pseudogymnoascus sp. VKM F-4281 (FW-2241)]|nr:hypothetical protein V493_00356 [Pseudogymnoascus sp. VKM F-4281 (FW-2241)]
MDGSSSKPVGEAGVALFEEEAQANARTPALETSQLEPQLEPLQPEPPQLNSPQQVAAEGETGDEDWLGLPTMTEEDAESIVGVSMNWALTRRSSTISTVPGSGPAVDLVGGEFIESDEERPSQQTATSQKLNLPEPWRAEPGDMVVDPTEEKRLSFRAKIATKRRSMSMLGSGESLRRLFLSVPTAGSIKLSLKRARNKATGSSSSSGQATPSSGGTTSRDVAGTGSPQTKDFAITLEADKTPNDGTTQPPLKRVISDSMLYSSLSRISSLGDDSRFENTHQMVNSRRKAISDSFSDSTYKISPTPNLPNIRGKLGSFTRSPNDNARGNAPSDGTKGHDSSTADPTLSSDKTEPSLFGRVIEHLTGDVVIMGGYRGSILKSKPSNRPLWIPPVGVGFNLGTVDLEVGLEGEDDERMEESVHASGMLRNIGVVDVSRRLFKRLRATENAKNGTLRVWDYGYDWRLNPHLLSRKLKGFLEGLPCNAPGKEKGALVIAHSLGGLITRHVVNQHPELFSGVIYAGTPQSCINIIGPLRNGDSVGFNQRIFTAQVNFTLRTSLVLLPLDGYGYIDKVTRTPYPVDFFDVNDWIKYRISPCTDQPKPAWNPPNPSLVSLITSSLTSVSIPGRKNASPSPGIGASPQTTGQGSVSKVMEALTSPLRKRRKAKNQSDASSPASGSPATSESMTVTLPRSAAIDYLTRILPIIRQFKLELAHLPDTEAANKYPPLAVIYAKNTPTVCAAKVDGREAIPCADVYDDLAFASGDGVCLAKDAQLPHGYRYVLGGRIRTERGHVTMLGDLEAVGKAIEAVYKGRERGIGLGLGNNEIWD